LDLDKISFKVVGTQGKYKDNDLVEFGKDDIQGMKYVFPGEPIPENWSKPQSQSGTAQRMKAGCLIGGC